MINVGDIMETIKMIDEENLDIRTITMGISLLDCADADIDKSCEKVYNKIVTKAGKLVEVGEEIKTFDYADDMNTWFDKIKKIAANLGFADDMKAYKENPDAFKGSITDVSNVIRVAVTGRNNSPDLCTVMQVLGKERVERRILAAAE